MQGSCAFVFRLLTGHWRLSRCLFYTENTTALCHSQWSPKMWCICGKTDASPRLPNMFTKFYPLLFCNVKPLGTGNQTSSGSEPNSMGVTPLWEWTRWLCHCSWVPWVGTQGGKTGFQPEEQQRQQSPGLPGIRRGTRLCAWVRTTLSCDLISSLIATYSSSNLSSTNTIYPLTPTSPPCFQALEKL